MSMAQLLSQMPIFANLSRQQIDVLAGRMQQVHVDAGQVIVWQGEPRHHLYVITEGKVAVIVHDASGEDTTVAHLGRG